MLEGEADSTTVFTPAAGQREKKVMVRKYRVQEMKLCYSKSTRALWKTTAAYRYIESNRKAPKRSASGGATAGYKSATKCLSTIVLMNDEDFAKSGFAEGEIVVLSQLSASSSIMKGGGAAAGRSGGRGASSTGPADESILPTTRDGKGLMQGNHTSGGGTQPKVSCRLC